LFAVFGANGFLGSYIIKSVIENTEDHVLAIARSIEGNPKSGRVQWFECDITNPGQVDALAQKLAQGEPCKIIDLAFWHNIDTVAQYPKDAWHTNITALAALLNKLDNIACFFFASTDCVYGEGKPGQCFKESDPLHPISLYGVHKAAAECLVRASGYHVLRLPYMFGPSLLSHKKHFYDSVADNLQHGNTVDLFYDSLRSSLDFETVANIFVRLVEDFSTLDLPNTLNLCGDDCLSKYDLGVLLANKLGSPVELVRPVSSMTLETADNAKRALNGLMDNTLLKSILRTSELKINI
jgi:dTDP-4-dehydrorhamnose reductase